MPSSLLSCRCHGCQCQLLAPLPLPNSRTERKITDPLPLPPVCQPDTIAATAALDVAASCGCLTAGVDPPAVWKKSHCRLARLRCGALRPSSSPSPSRARWRRSSSTSATILATSRIHPERLVRRRLPIDDARLRDGVRLSSLRVLGLRLRPRLSLRRFDLSRPPLCRPPPQLFC